MYIKAGMNDLSAGTMKHP